MKAVVANACSNNKDCFAIKRRPKAANSRLRHVSLSDHCITDYFKIECFEHNQTDCENCGFKATLPLSIRCQDVDIKADFEERNIIESVQDDYLMLDSAPKLQKIFSSPSTPHRIQLHPQLSESKDVNQINQGLSVPDFKNHINGKITTKIGKKEAAPDHKLTEYFPVRRSVRKTKQTVLEEKKRNLEQLLRDGVEEGLEVHNFEGKGRGIVAVRPFNRGDFVVEYSGELLDVVQAKKREELYAQDANTGCYMYYFKHQNQQYCIDATAESGRLGRLVNHSRNGNLITRTVVVDGLPHLVLIAKDYIKTGEEICYDYGDRSKESLKNHPWLAF